MVATLAFPWSWRIFWIGGSVPKAPPPQPPPDKAAAETAGAEEMKRAKQARGARANILTSPTGADLGGIGGDTTTSTPKTKLGGY